MNRGAMTMAITMMVIGLGALTSGCVESVGSYQPSFSYPDYEAVAYGDGEGGWHAGWQHGHWNDNDGGP